MAQEPGLLHRVVTPTYLPSQKVWLSTRDIHIRLPTHKLSPRYIEPFMIQRQINPVSIRQYYSTSLFLFAWILIPYTCGQLTGTCIKAHTHLHEAVWSHLSHKCKTPAHGSSSSSSSAICLHLHQCSILHYRKTVVLELSHSSACLHSMLFSLINPCERSVLQCLVTLLLINFVNFLIKLNKTALILNLHTLSV